MSPTVLFRGDALKLFALKTINIYKIYFYLKNFVLYWNIADINTMLMSGLLHNDLHTLCNDHLYKSSNSSFPHKSEVKFPQLCLTFCNPIDYSSWDSPGQNTRVGSLSLLQEIFATQRLNPGLLHWRWILYLLSHQGSLYKVIIIL